MAATGGATPPRTACAWTTTQVGAALSFLPGQDGADGTWGHVAVVEAVYGDGTFQISEMNVGGLWMMNYRTLTNLGQYWFVH